MIQNIIIDVDDVILDWSEGFDQWVRDTKKYTGPHIKNDHRRLSEIFYPEIYFEFNQSDVFQNLPIIDDSIKCLNDLSEIYQINLISSCGIEFKESRMMQLNKILQFDYNLIVLNLHEPKYKYIYKLQPKVMIDDNVDNIKFHADLNIGKSYLFLTEFNKHFHHNNIIRTNSWKEIEKSLQSVIVAD